MGNLTAGNCKREMSQYKSAIESFEESLKHPGGSQTAAMSNIGYCYWSLGHITQALEWIEKTLAKYEADWASPLNIAVTLTGMATSTFKNFKSFKYALI